MSRSKKSGRVTPAEVDEIVRLRLYERLSYREIADRIGRDKDTVNRHWNRYLAECADRRAEEHETQLVELLMRYDTLAEEARRLRRETEDIGEKQRLIDTENRALAQIGKLAGLEKLTLDHQGGGNFTVVIREEVDDPEGR